MKRKPVRPTFLFPLALIGLLASCNLGNDELEFVSSAVWTRAYDAEVQGGYAYCSFLNGLVILDVTDSENPQKVSQLYLGGGAGIAVADGRVYVSTQEGQILCFGS